MVRAALTPMSASDRFCIYFLNKYSLIHGDAAPNDFERALDQGTIKSQYVNFYVPQALDRYETSRSQQSSLSSKRASECGLPVSSIGNVSDSSSESESESDNEITLGGPVSYSRFCELWRVIFPDLVNRPYRAILGKCKWCGLFETGRKTSDNAVTYIYIIIPCNVCFDNLNYLCVNHRKNVNILLMHIFCIAEVV